MVCLCGCTSLTEILFVSPHALLDSAWCFDNISLFVRAATELFLLLLCPKSFISSPLKHNQSFPPHQGAADGLTDDVGVAGEDGVLEFI